MVSQLLKGVGLSRTPKPSRTGFELCMRLAAVLYWRAAVLVQFNDVRAFFGRFQKITEKEKHLEEPVVYSGVKSISRYHHPPPAIRITVSSFSSS